METSGGILGRLGEKFLGWIALALLILIGVAIWRMDPVLKTAAWQGAWRTVFWIALAAALPWSARFFIRRILEVGSNWAGAGLLAAFLVVDLGAGLLLLSGCDATIDARRQEVARELETEDDGGGMSANPLPAGAAPGPGVGDVVRDKLADVAEGAAEVARQAADRLRADGAGSADESDRASAETEVDPLEDHDDSGHGGWFWFACVAALALAGTYNYLVTEYLSEMAGG